MNVWVCVLHNKKKTNMNHSIVVYQQAILSQKGRLKPKTSFIGFLLIILNIRPTNLFFLSVLFFFFVNSEEQKQKQTYH